jgi:chromosome segregation ATPase
VSRLFPQLDLALLARLRHVVAGEVATETELRMLADEAEGWLRALETELQAAEKRLGKLNADRASPLTEVAASVRRVDALFRERNEARDLLEGLEHRTRELRTAWLKRDAEAGSPFSPRSS